MKTIAHFYKAPKKLFGCPPPLPLIFENWKKVDLLKIFLKLLSTCLHFDTGLKHV